MIVIHAQAQIQTTFPLKEKGIEKKPDCRRPLFKMFFKLLDSWTEDLDLRPANFFVFFWGGKIIFFNKKEMFPGAVPAIVNEINSGRGWGYKVWRLVFHPRK